MKELHPEKTRLIEFGRFAASTRARRRQGKPETFDFLGFTHSCGKTRKTGSFVVLRRTMRKRMTAKLQAVKEELRRRRHTTIGEQGKYLRQEPDAIVPHVRICAGGVEQSASLPHPGWG